MRGKLHLFVGKMFAFATQDKWGNYIPVITSYTVIISEAADLQQGPTVKEYVDTGSAPLGERGLHLLETVLRKAAKQKIRGPINMLVVAEEQGVEFDVCGESFGPDQYAEVFTKVRKEICLLYTSPSPRD